MLGRRLSGPKAVRLVYVPRIVIVTAVTARPVKGAPIVESAFRPRQLAGSQASLKAIKPFVG
jgi:hypothetical protein